jgi:hypothetical protein
MTPEIKILIASIILLGLAISGIAIRMFLKKGGEFKKQCSSVDPQTGERYGCTCGKNDGGDSCDNH